MNETLRILLVEDVEDDAWLVLRQLEALRRPIVHRRVETAEQMREALQNQPWDAVISDYCLPRFSAPLALALLKETGLDLPFIIVSGTIGDEIAIEVLKHGAHDYLIKGRLARLIPALERELEDAAVRRARRQAEEALRQSEARFRTLVESLEELVFTLDREQRYVGVFGRALERKGLQPEVLLGKTQREVRGDAGAAVHEAANGRALRGERVLYEWSTAALTEPRHYQTSLAPLFGEAGAVVGIAGLERDVTEQRRLAAQLIVSDRMAQMGTLAAGVAHEINNPLAAALANLDLGLRTLTELAERPSLGEPLREVLEQLTDARDAAENMRAIVRDLKVFSRDSMDEIVSVDVNDVLESSARLAWNEIRHRAKLVKDLGPVPRVAGTDSRLSQVFLNLLVNAAQAIPEGAADRNVIHLRTRAAPDGRVVVEVEDTGEGIAPDAMEKLFTPFYTTKPSGIGTGLGLPICHRILTSLGGEIHVQSEPGRGSTFTVTLLSTTETERSARPSRLPVSFPCRRGAVLVVDDEPTILRVIQRILRKEHEVTLIERARDALALIESGQRFDLILCDLMMPEITGMDLHRLLLDHAPDQAGRMVFLSGGAFTPRAREFLASIGNPVLEKPFDPTALRRFISERVSAEPGPESAG